MLTTRTGAKLATERPPTSEHTQRMHAVVMKFNGSGIYIVCEITFSFTKRLPTVLVDSYSCNCQNLSFIYCSFVVFPD